MKKTISLLILTLLFISCKKNIVYYNNIFVLDTVMSLVIVRDIDIDTDELLKKIIKRIKELDTIFNVFDEKSEISKINNLANINPISLSNELYYVINKSIYYSQLTDGAFDPTLLSLKKIWDLKSSKLNKLPDSIEIKKALETSGYKNIILQKNKKIKIFKRGLGFDLGGIAKGFIIDEIVYLIKNHGLNNFIVNIGGDVYCSGSLKKRNWIVGIQHPRNNEEFIEKINVKDKSIVTSGDYQRYKLINNKRYHHIIDPKTGYPSFKCISTSVIANHALDADALSTAIFVMGKEKGLKLIDSLPDVEALIVIQSENNKIEKYYSKGFNKYIIQN